MKTNIKMANFEKQLFNQKNFFGLHSRAQYMYIYIVNASIRKL